MNQPPPESCPGVASDAAGKHEVCKGCPNANICASGQAKAINVEEDVNEIARKLFDIKHIILVMSGKGI